MFTLSYPIEFTILFLHFSKSIEVLCLDIYGPQYLTPPWEDTFDSYHFCDEKRNLKIVHRNGCGPLPQMCGNPRPDPTRPYWAGKKNFMIHLHMDVEAFWGLMSDVTQGRVRFQVYKENSV